MAFIPNMVKRIHYAGLCWELQFPDTPVPEDEPTFPSLPIITLNPAAATWPTLDRHIHSRLEANGISMAGGHSEAPRRANTIVRSPQACSWQHLKGGNRITRHGILGSKTFHRNYSSIKFEEGHIITGEEARNQSKDIVDIEGVNWNLLLIGKSYIC